MIAFKGINYIKNVKANLNEVPVNTAVLNRILRKNRLKDILCFMGLIPYNSLCCIVFKQEPDAELLSRLKAEKFTIIHLPKNPYL